MVVLENDWNGILDATHNGLSVTDLDNVFDATPSDGALGNACACVSICVADTFWRANYLEFNLFACAKFKHVQDVLPIFSLSNDKFYLELIFFSLDSTCP